MPDYRPGDHFAPRDLPLLDRFSGFALLAAREAIMDAGFVAAQELPPLLATEQVVPVTVYATIKGCEQNCFARDEIIVPVTYPLDR